MGNCAKARDAFLCIDEKMKTVPSRDPKCPVGNDNRYLSNMNWITISTCKQLVKPPEVSLAAATVTATPFVMNTGYTGQGYMLRAIHD